MSRVPRSWARGRGQGLTTTKTRVRAVLCDFGGGQSASAGWFGSRPLVIEVVGNTDARGDRLFTVRPDGSHRHRLSAGVANGAPDWAPGGHWLTYQHDDGYVWVMRADGQHRHSLGVRGQSPAWSPNGARIAYIGHADDVIHTVRRDGTNDRTLGAP